MVLRTDKISISGSAQEMFGRGTDARTCSDDLSTPPQRLGRAVNFEVPRSTRRELSSRSVIWPIAC